MQCVQAYQLACRGDYEGAMEKLVKNDPSSYRTLRMHNLHFGFANMIRLKQALHLQVDSECS